MQAPVFMRRLLVFINKYGLAYYQSGVFFLRHPVFYRQSPFSYQSCALLPTVGKDPVG